MEDGINKERKKKEERKLTVRISSKGIIIIDKLR